MMAQNKFSNSPLRPGAVLLALAILGLVPLGCTREAPAPPEEGSQVSQNQQATEPAPPPTPAQEQAPAAPPAQAQQAPPKSAPHPRTVSSAPAPPAPREPETVAVTVPASTTLNVKMEDALDSGTSQPGDHFTATLQQPILVGDRVALPAGSSIEGTVTDVIPAKKGIKESGGALTLSFDKVTPPSGEAARMSASLSKVAKSTKKKAGTIGGAAAGGALLGKIFGGSTKDAAVGAVVGGAIGTGVAAGTKGTEMKIEAGTALAITLQQPLTVHLKR
jgi:hypothetical protein